MKLKLIFFVLLSSLILLAACGNDEKENQSDEIVALEVEFVVPEMAEVGETVELKAIVSYGDEKVKDADEMKFEYWVKGDEDNTTTVESTNNGDGTYTAEVTFDHDGVYEMFAHTTAKSFHTMPKKSITIGEGIAPEDGEAQHDHGAEHEHGHTEGFSMHFMEPENVKVNEETNLIVHLQLDDKALESANVRYEIFNNDDKHDWVDAKEDKSGEYMGSYSFKEAGIYTVKIHVENDEGLHEHKEYQVDVQ